MWFFTSLYVQQVLGWDAIETGLGFLPMTIGVAIASSRAPRLAARFGARATITAGMSLAALGLLILTGMHPGGGYLETVLPGGLAAAVGLGLALVPSTIVAVQGVPAAEAGVASGLLNTSRLLGGALGLAVLSTIADAQTHAALRGGAPALAALTDGYGRALLVGALIVGAGAVAAAALLRTRAVARASAPKPARARSARRRRKRVRSCPAARPAPAEPLVVSPLATAPPRRATESRKASERHRTAGAAQGGRPLPARRGKLRRQRADRERAADDVPALADGAREDHLDRRLGGDGSCPASRC